MKATFNFGLLLVVIVMTGQPSSVALCETQQESARVYNQNTETTVKGTVEQSKQPIFQAVVQARKHTKSRAAQFVLTSRLTGHLCGVFGSVLVSGIQRRKIR